MTFLHEFLLHIHAVKDFATQRVLARIALNAVYDRTAYPVDLTELTDLAVHSRAIALAFLDGCEANPRLKTMRHGDTIAELVSIADSDGTCHA